MLTFILYEYYFYLKLIMFLFTSSFIFFHLFPFSFSLKTKLLDQFSKDNKLTTIFDSSNYYALIFEKIQKEQIDLFKNINKKLLIIKANPNPELISSSIQEIKYFKEKIQSKYNSSFSLCNSENFRPIYECDEHKISSGITLLNKTIEHLNKFIQESKNTIKKIEENDLIKNEVESVFFMAKEISSRNYLSDLVGEIKNFFHENTNNITTEALNQIDSEFILTREAHRNMLQEKIEWYLSKLTDKFKDINKEGDILLNKFKSLTKEFKSQIKLIKRNIETQNNLIHKSLKEVFLKTSLQKSCNRMLKIYDMCKEVKEIYENIILFLEAQIKYYKEIKTMILK